MGGKAASRLDRFREVYLPRFRERFGPCRVILFGSWARGDALVDSDLDLIVVSGAFQGLGFLERAIRVLEETDLVLGADLLCYTPEEFERKRAEEGIVKTAVAEGIVLEPAA